MTMLNIYQVDAFTTQLFGGNPAAVVVLDEWLNDHLLQSIAAENNLAETAYLVPVGENWELRWFTPTAEVALCGHATLASAHVLVTQLKQIRDQYNFITRESGTLTVELKPHGALAMSFPAIAVSQPKNDVATDITAALAAKPIQILLGHYTQEQYDYVAVFNSESEVAALNPELPLFKSLNSRGVIATAKGNSCDFVSRYFAPNIGIDEDPVTGSAHCLLAPYWSDIIGNSELNARQISKRGGEIFCSVQNNRVVLTGHAVNYLVGEINL